MHPLMQAMNEAYANEGYGINYTVTPTMRLPHSRVDSIHIIIQM